MCRDCDEFQHVSQFQTTKRLFVFGPWIGLLTLYGHLALEPIGKNGRKEGEKEERKKESLLSRE
jgi:hypothetical protein